MLKDIYSGLERILPDCGAITKKGISGISNTLINGSATQSYAIQFKATDSYNPNDLIDKLNKELKTVRKARNGNIHVNIKNVPDDRDSFRDYMTRL